MPERRVLDVGCGTGEHALMAAEAGLDATGVDFAATAIALARRKAAGRGLDARFLVWDALDLDWGPRRVRREEITGSFADGWRVEGMEPAALEITMHPGSVRAWHATVLRT